MRKFLWLLIPLALITAGCSTAESRLIGKWRGKMEVGQQLQSTPMGAMAANFRDMIDPQLSLRPDHTFTLSFSIAPIDGTWKLDKSDIVLTPKTMMGMTAEDANKQAEKAIDKAKAKSPFPIPFLSGGSLPMMKEMRVHTDQKMDTLTLDPGAGTMISGFGKITFTKV